MSKENKNVMLEKVVCQLEISSTVNNRIIDQNYLTLHQHLQNALVDSTLLQRILGVCARDLKEDLKCTPIILNILSDILKKVKAGDYEDELDLESAALSVINVILSLSSLNHGTIIKNKFVEVLLLFPDKTLELIATEYSDMLKEIFNLPGLARNHIEFRVLTYDILYRLLQILPHEKKIAFVKDGLSLWFSKIIPTIVNYATGQIYERFKPFDMLEALTDVIVTTNYTNNAQWLPILECICNANKYPQIMKMLLERGNPVWYKLWIVFIKLLNNQITRSTCNVGTPINSMLPVVETAFKMDATNRCKAFKCWSVLIDNFSKETNENCIMKRLKLLVIPLKLNNAKTEGTAMAKFEAWWLLIEKFQSKLDKFIDVVMISFLHFCFGKHNSSGKTTFVPGQLSENLKKFGVQALVEIVGHDEKCEGCTDLSRLNERLLNTKYLINYWKDWVHSMIIAMKYLFENGNKQHILCLCHSFLLIIAKLPDSNVKRGVLNELLTVLRSSIQNGVNEKLYDDTIFDVAVSFIFKEELKLVHLLKPKDDEENGPLSVIISIITDLSLKRLYERHTIQSTIAELKPLTGFIINDSSKCTSVSYIQKMLHNLPVNKVTLIFWTALADSLCNSDHEICLKDICDMLRWPLKTSNRINDVQYAAKMWYKVYDTNFLKLSKTDIDEDISKLIPNCNIVLHSHKYFMLCATIAILKNGLTKYDSNEYEKEADNLRNLLNRVDSYENIEELFPMLVDTLVVMLNNLTNMVNEKFAETTLKSVQILFNLIVPALKPRSDINNVVTLLKMLLKSIESFIEVESYSKLYPVIFDTLKKCCVPFENQSLLKDVTQSILKKTSKNEQSNDIVQDSIDLTLDNVEMKINENKDKFTTPNTKDVPKRSKKKEASIVNTVVENGEEFVVVKSNWKFNPRKLTENQKEKFQRKREDIPALYQDLSQSQDEFKMTVWKTDSQDNSTSSKSNSKSTNDASNTTDILQKIASADVVPKIMENILADKDKKENGDDIDKTNQSLGKDSTNHQVTISKSNKTPRMALKDRVFRNVRNLIEKSTTPSSSSSKEVSCEQTDIQNILKTPPLNPKDSAAIVNSAPSLLLCDRPSRVKRKPRKFDDTEIFLTNKRRHSQSDTPANVNCEDDSPKDVIESVKTLEMFGNKENTALVTEISVQACQENLDDAKVVENTTLVNETTCTELGIVDQDISDKSEGNVPAITDTDVAKMIDVSSKYEVQNYIKGDSKEPDKENTTVVDCNKTEDVSTPKRVKGTVNRQASVKKSSVKKSRIEKELAIDMVEGHPFLNTPSTSERRKTRKNLASPVSSVRKNKVGNKLNKSKSDPKSSLSIDTKEKSSEVEKSNSDELNKSDKRCTNSPESFPISEESCSEDVIESSQDSTLTPINVIKKTPKRFPIVSIKKLEVILFQGNNLADNTSGNDYAQEKSKDGDEKNNRDEIENNAKEDSNITNVTNVIETPEVCNKVFSENLLNTNNMVEFVSSDSFMHNECNDDTDLPRNKTALEDKNGLEVTEDMDTESIIISETCDDVSTINDDEQQAASVTRDESVVGTETQEIADADTQPNDTIDVENKTREIAEADTLPNVTKDIGNKTQEIADADTQPNETASIDNETQEICDADIQTDETRDFEIQMDCGPCLLEENIVTKENEKFVDVPLNEKENGVSTPASTNNNTPLINLEKSSDVSSPFKDDDQRRQDFLNNTNEISPIKTVSPDREHKSPSPDSSNDYVVIKLSSPVQSNGEPFEKGSPEFFTEDKISPDKRNQSPPRSEIAVTNTSPSSSLSLKKRPQVRSGGRAAQMLGLCVPDKLNPRMNSDRIEIDEGRKSSPNTTPARRNLRILYNSVGDTSDNLVENEENENFLRLRRSLPSVSSSPTGPILKRKLAEITDDTSLSPANKRKRVSFHDPPVSTTIAVQKYIEPCGVRSPQNSVQKRQERQARMQANLKSPKRLDNLFNLDSALTSTVESFRDVGFSSNITDDTQMTSLDQTPAAEIVRTSELNDTDPICPELLDCKDSIENIATELSSPAMKDLLIKELEGKVETIGDLAKMTELEVNRLCIKAPKVKVAKKVLSDYATKIESNKELMEITGVDIVVDGGILTPPDEVRCSEIAIQTNELLHTDSEMQTCDVPVSLVSTQTEEASTSSVSAQTIESGSRTTAEIIQTCMAEKSDFVAQLSEQLCEDSVKEIATKLSFECATETLMSNIDQSNSKIVLDRLLDCQNIQNTDENTSSKQLAFLRDYLCDKFESRDLILFCSDLMKKMYDKPK